MLQTQFSVSLTWDGYLRYYGSLWVVLQLDLHLLTFAGRAAFRDEAIVAIQLDWFACEKVALDVREYVIKSFGVQVLASIEKEIGRLLVQLLFRDLLPEKVVVAVPLAVEGVARKTDVVAEAQGTIVVHYAVQIVYRFDPKLLLEEIGVGAELGDVQIADGEVYKVLQLAPLVPIKTEAFELDD